MTGRYAQNAAAGDEIEGFRDSKCGSNMQGGHRMTETGFSDLRASHPSHLVVDLERRDVAREVNRGNSAQRLKSPDELHEEVDKSKVD